MIGFEEDVYMVKGYTNAAIYDLKQGYLYSIGPKEYSFIEKVLAGYKPELFSYEETLFFEHLIKSRCLTDTKKASTSSLKQVLESYESPTFTYAWIEVTQKCNMSCIHCYGAFGNKLTNEMSISDYKFTVDKLFKMGIKRIQLIGGEPLLHQAGITRLLDYAKNKFDTVEVFTNGYLIGENFVQYCKNNSIRVAVSIYSDKEDMHDQVTQLNGSYRKTMKAIELLKKYDVQFRVSTILMKGINVDTHNLRSKISNYSTDIMRISGRGNLDKLSRSQIRRKLITIDKFKKPLDYSLTLLQAQFNRCFSRKIYIDVNLDVFPCVMERRLKHGNLVNLTEFSDEILKLNKDKVEGCKDCELRYACNDCRPDSLSDNPYSKPWNCTYDPYTGKWEDPQIYIDRLLST